MRALPIVFIAVMVVAADQVSKRLIETVIEPLSPVSVMTNFNLVHSDNRGISFGLFASRSSYGPYILSFVALCIAAGLAAWAFRTKSAIQRTALAMIIGGAVSNIHDRLDDGAVTDFLDFHIGGYHWPAFNLADAAIVCGSAALVLNAIMRPTKSVI